MDYDQLAAEYARHRRVQPEVLRALIATGRIEKGSRVLEVGCGTGNYIVALEEAVGCSCWAIEPSAQMLARAQERSRGVTFRSGMAEHLDFPAGSFDLVFSVDVIHHLGSYKDYFREAYRVLRPGGRICTATDSEWVICHRQPLASYFPETVEVELERYPRIARLREAMARVGFAALSEENVTFAYPLTDIQPYRDKAFSSLHLIPEAAYRRGIARMEEDLLRGPIAGVSYYLLLWGTG